MHCKLPASRPRVLGCLATMVVLVFLTSLAMVPAVPEPTRMLVENISDSLFSGSWHPAPATGGERIVCPAQAKYRPLHLCSSSRLGREQHLEYRAHGLQHFDAKEFVTRLRATNRTLLFVGDSLAEQHFNAMMCLVEEQLGAKTTLKNRQGKPLVSLRWSYYLGKFPQVVTDHVELRAFSADERQRLGEAAEDESWVQYAIDTNAEAVVIGTGAWFSHWRFRERGTPCTHDAWPTASMKIVGKAFGIHIRLSLKPLVLKLHTHGIAVVWRDVGPAGDNHEMKYSADYAAFKKFNNIAYRELAPLGVVMMPTFDLLAQRWRRHVAEDFKGHDYLHWCSYTKYSIPVLWVHMLYSLMHNIKAGEGGDTADSAMAVRARGDGDRCRCGWNLTAFSPWKDSFFCGTLWGCTQNDNSCASAAARKATAEQRLIF